MAKVAFCYDEALGNVFNLWFNLRSKIGVAIEIY